MQDKCPAAGVRSGSGQGRPHPSGLPASKTATLDTKGAFDVNYTGVMPYTVAGPRRKRARTNADRQPAPRMLRPLE